MGGGWRGGGVCGVCGREANVGSGACLLLSFCFLARATMTVDAPPAEPAPPPSKKAKQGAADAPVPPPPLVIRPSLLSAESATALAAAYASAAPFPHAQLADVIDPAVLRAARDEIVEHVQATYKETDLFKVFQTGEERAKEGRERREHAGPRRNASRRLGSWRAPSRAVALLPPTSLAVAGPLSLLSLGDLGNLDALDASSSSKLPALLALKASLYSEPFRAFIRSVTGCGPLAPTTDCSANVYARGGHLLTHDDVIGSRRVSWILYLTDPDEAWSVGAEGGGLELFPLASPGAVGTPGPIPATVLPPTWNSLALFTVAPGVSFHAVQEVTGEAKPRLSISGWFHAPAGPDGEAGASASLAQLQLRRGADCLSGHVAIQAGAAASGSASAPPITTGDALTEADLSFLKLWVNPAYLRPAAWGAVRAQFEADGSVQLHRFLRPDLARRIGGLTRAADAADGLGGWRLPPSAGVGARAGGWELVGPPHKQRYLAFMGLAAAPASLTAGGGDGGDGGGDAPASDPAAAAGAALAAVQAHLLTSPAFARLLKACTTLTLLAVAPDGPRRFRAGLDYTVAHYGAITASPRLDAVLCFVDEAGEGDGETSPWAAGDVGGFEAYLLADEEEGGPAGSGKASASASAAAAAVYRAADADAGVINAPAAANCLNLTLRDDGLMRFVKYVSAGAPGSRWDVAVEFLPEDDGEEEEEEDRGEEEGGEEEEEGGEEGGG